jgi:hypothetical protein
MPDPESTLSPRNGGSRPVPDPTELTDRAISRLEASLTQYINGQLSVRDERLAGIDEATKLRLRGVDEIPDQISEKVGRLADVVLEKFKSVDKQFSERDTRQERESRDNKVAVDAAFAAQKEAASTQDVNNAKAIDKSETATKELLRTLDDRISDLKGRLDRGEGRTTGGIDARTLMMSVLGLLLIAASLVIAFKP